MKIVALDTYTLDHDGLTWSAFEALGDFQCYPRSHPSELLDRAAYADAILTNKFVLDHDAINSLRNLRYIGVTATGVNNVDIAAAQERDIVVTNVSSYSTWSTAQHTVSLLLELSCRVGEYSRLVATGAWSKSEDFCIPAFPTIELYDKTLGIIGFGEIGKRVAKIAEAFGMKILVAKMPGRTYHDETSRVPLEQLLRCSDVVSLHCPLTPDTKHIIDTSSLQSMKPSAFLINTARGPLIDETALAAALKNDTIAGAAVDVLSEEPPRSTNPLLTAPRITITPHIAWLSREARCRLMHEAFMNLQAYCAGESRNVVG